MNVLTKEVEEESFNPNIYRMGSTDTWGCDKCTQKGDIHYMKNHICTSKKNDRI